MRDYNDISMRIFRSLPKDFQIKGLAYMIRSGDDFASSELSFDYKEEIRKTDVANLMLGYPLNSELKKMVNSGLITNELFKPYET